MEDGRERVETRLHPSPSILHCPTPFHSPSILHRPLSLPDFKVNFKLTLLNLEPFCATLNCAFTPHVVAIT
ncbi:MAG: hypothetical protein MAG451_01510 [Anaerolineales bacterium]|nr:hypothetical protein [Anaerolineales bacterium]